MRHLIKAMLTAAAVLAATCWGTAAQAQAQTAAAFPNKTIRIVVPYTPGGTTDIMARNIGLKLTEYWGQPVIVDNRPGTNGPASPRRTASGFLPASGKTGTPWRGPCFWHP